MASFNLLFSIFGWAVIPDFATRHLLNYIYKSPVKLFSPAQPGSRQFRKHYALTFSFVIFSYLCYTLYQSSKGMAPSFYEILAVPPDVDEGGLKVAFRAFAKKYHPDKVGGDEEGVQLFMQVRDAFEALKDPVVRFAYDRFGPEVLGWRKTCKTTREFMHHGLMVSSGYHIVAGIALLFWSAIGQPSPVSFWRYVLFGALFAGELSFIVSPFPGSQSNIFPENISFLSPGSDGLAVTGTIRTFSILQTIFPNRVPYQHILFLHQCFMILSVALSRVVPHFVYIFSDGDPNARTLDPLEKEVWERVYSTIAIADREASIILHTLLQSVTRKPASTTHPYHIPTLARMEPLSEARTNEIFEELTPEMCNLVMEANIKNQTAGPIANAWDAALRKSYAVAVAGSEKSADGSTPTQPRLRNFWEAAESTGDTESSIVFVDPLSESATVDRMGRSPRVPSTPRSRRREPSTSPTKGSPVRKAAIPTAPGEI